MDLQGIHDHLRAVEAPGVLRADLPRPKNPEDKKDPGRAGDPYLWVDPQAIPELLKVCRDDPALSFELLVDLTATDPSADDESLWVHWQLCSVRRRHRLALKAEVPKSAPSLPTSVGVYRAAQWHERECAEMFGIAFLGHPDPRNILLPDDWEGYPLRKDYEFPKEYHGISCE